MSAIAGVLSAREAPPERLCRHMLESQAEYGPHHRALWADKGVALGRNLFRLLPEDEFDRQPLAGCDGRFRLVADVRIDNRSDLIERLGSAAASGRELSDAALLLLGWERWGEGLLDRLRGDYAFAVHDAANGIVHLIRDVIGQRPLHYRSGSGEFAFASMPEALLDPEGHGRGFDKARLAEFVADLPNFGSSSFYHGISRVEPGTIVTAGPDRDVRVRRYWNPSVDARPSRAGDDLAAELRERLDRAVAVRMRRYSGALGSHLSSGLDSSAVAATAARNLPSEPLHAFTSAPRIGFAGPVPAGRIADETPLAATVAARYPNIEHVVLRPGGASPLSHLPRTHALAQQPTGHVCNNSWWCAINDEARARGVSVMLTGELGNLGLSAGGYFMLEDLIRAGRLRDWWREARASGLPMRRAVDLSLAGFLPLSVQDGLRRVLAGSRPKSPKPAFLGPSWAAAVAASANAKPIEARSVRALNLKLIRRTDPGCFRKAVLGGWGIDERDPTADRDLVEFCLTLPTDALLKDGVERPLLKTALQDRLPPELLGQGLRGYQMADWYEQIPQDDVRKFASAIRANPATASLLDWEEVDAAIENWPETGWELRPIIYRFRMRLLRALSAAEFLGSRPGRQAQAIARAGS